MKPDSERDPAPRYKLAEPVSILLVLTGFAANVAGIVTALLSIFAR